jgi:ATP-dependent helicase IRC3
VYNTDSRILVWGCSATLRRHDGKSLFPTFESVEYQQPASAMLERKWLCPVRLFRVKTNVDIKDVGTVAGDFNLKELVQAINVKARNQLVLSTYMEHVRPKGCKSTLVFAVNINHVNALLKEFRDAGIEAYSVDSTTPIYEREELLERFKQKQFPVLVNCAIITEGVDLPNIDCIMLARPTKSGVLMQQMLGRGMRLHPDKTECIVMDFVDSVKPSMMLATVPTLMGLASNAPTRDKLLKTFSESDFVSGQSTGIPLELKLDEEKCLEEAKYESTYEVLPTFKDVFTLQSVRENHSVLKNSTKLPWVRIDEYKLILTLYPTNQFIQLQKEEGVYCARLYRKTPKATVYVADILTHDTLSSALHALETYVKEKLGYMIFQDLTAAPWRISRPSKKQLQYLEQVGVPKSPTMTKGEAADLITRSIFGAKGNARRVQMKSEKLTRLLSKYRF